jgi:hypothetical protein
MSISPSDVRLIADFEELDNSAISAFIDDAKNFIQNHVGDLDPTTTDILVKWTTAHLASMKQQRIREEGFTDASLDYEGKSGMNLNYTRYGQQVVALDPTDSLGSDGSGGSEDGHYVTAVSSEADYEPLSAHPHK